MRPSGLFVPRCYRCLNPSGIATEFRAAGSTIVEIATRARIFLQGRLDDLDCPCGDGFHEVLTGTGSGSEDSAGTGLKVANLGDALQHPVSFLQRKQGALMDAPSWWKPPFSSGVDGPEAEEICFSQDEVCDASAEH